MRYFKCKKDDAPENGALRAQYAELTGEEQRSRRKGKRLDVAAKLVFTLVTLLSAAGCVYAILQIPEPGNVFFAILHHIGTVILVPVSVLVSCVIGLCAASPFRSRADSTRRGMKRRILSEACAHLRAYYGLQAPCIVTKCYDSSEKDFARHDVCIFVVEDELRITGNLEHGFFHAEKDLGCYAFRAEEISLTEKHSENLVITVLRTGDTFFLLGRRAKGFIQRHFLATEIST